MEAIQFITCNCDKCGFNEGRGCRASSVCVDENGYCLADDNKAQKSPVHSYVKIDECENEECDSWEYDEATDKGRCGLEESLHFAPGEDDKPLCWTYFRQIGSPPWSARVDV